MIRRSTWIVVGAFAVVLVGALLLNLREDQSAPVDSTPTPEPMWSVASEEIVALVVENLEAGETIALERDSEDLWRIVSPQPGPTDAARVERAVSWLASPAPRTELHDISDLTPFQLSEPSYRVEITLEDGSKLSFSVGREAPTGGSRYVSVPDRPGVLVVSNLGLQEVLNLQPDLLPTPTPEPSATATEAGLPAAETPTP